jgi:protease-4
MRVMSFNEPVSLSENFTYEPGFTGETAALPVALIVGGMENSLGVGFAANIPHVNFRDNLIDKQPFIVYPERNGFPDKGVRMKNFDLTWTKIRGWLLWIVIPLLIGVLIASAIPRPIVGVIRLDDAIYSTSARDMIAQIKYASEHPEVRAVVLAFDSPGGTVVDTEAVYMEIARLRAKKPVVTAINAMAASGAYYLSVNTDYIYAKPTSLVGNVGVIGYLPPVPFIYEELISTGPYKLWGSPRDSEMRQIDMIKDAFYQAVTLGRGDRLKAGPEVVLSGQIWLGTEAARLGLIDEIGTESDAADKAAELARIAHYKTADLRALAGIPDPYPAFFIESPEGVTLPYPKEAGIYMLYIPQLPAQK